MGYQTKIKFARLSLRHSRFGAAVLTQTKLRRNPRGSPSTADQCSSVRMMTLCLYKYKQNEEYTLNAAHSRLVLTMLEMNIDRLQQQELLSIQLYSVLVVNTNDQTVIVVFPLNHGGLSWAVQNQVTPWCPSHPWPPNLTLGHQISTLPYCPAHRHRINHSYPCPSGLNQTDAWAVASSNNLIRCPLTCNTKNRAPQSRRDHVQSDG